MPSRYGARIVTDAAVRSLWTWFEAHADDLESMLTGAGTHDALCAALTARVHTVHPRMSWEIGPESESGGHFFAFGPSGDPSLLALARRSVACAPEIAGWTFRSARPPKAWRERVVVLPLEGARRRVSFDEWRFVARTRADGVIEITLYGHELADLSQPSRQVLGWLLLDAELGEEVTSSRPIELDVEPLNTGVVARPIAELRAIDT
jgi:hypothetical protein